MLKQKVCVVTGSNKGIGKSIVKLLLQDADEKIVYLTSRDVKLGQQAIEELASEFGITPEYHQLDITDQSSIDRLRDHLVERHGGLDVLVNNAGVAFKSTSTVPFAEQAQTTVSVNFFGTLAVCETLLPILREEAHIVHVSSRRCVVAYQALSEEKRKLFADENLTIQGLKSLLEDFLACAQSGTAKENGYQQNSYNMSKLGVTLMAKLQQKQLQNKRILVNACCPGIVATDMSSAVTSPEMIGPDEGADTPLYLALLPYDDEAPKGCYLRLRKVVPLE